MTASFQCSRRDGRVRGLVFRQGRLACALVIAATINVRVSAQAGAEGLDVVPFSESDSIWQCAFSPPYPPFLPPFVPSKHPSSMFDASKSAVFFLWAPTHLPFVHCSPPRGPREPAVCHCYQPLSPRKRFDVILRLIWPSSETGCMCELCWGFLGTAGVASHSAY